MSEVPSAAVERRDLTSSGSTGVEVTVRAQDLSRNYGDKRAVRDVDLELRRGEVLGLLGPNGAGKTTTMQMLTGNLAPTTGSIDICGVDLLERPTDAKARIGYLPETPPLYRELKVDEFLQLAARLHRVPKARIAVAVADAKRKCGLSDAGGRMIATLSKGYQQRVGIAQAIIHEPDVVILDEPTIGLDPNQIREIRDLIRDLGGKHSVILSTHILPEVEAICDRVQIMYQGSIVYNDSIEALRRSRKAQTLLLGLRRAPSLESIKAVPGVSGVELGNDGLLRVLHAQDQEPTDALVKAAVEKSWGLYHLTREHASLEDVFVQLTQGKDRPVISASTQEAA